MTDPVRRGVQKRERRVTVSLRVPERIKAELTRIGKRRYQTMSAAGANLLIEAVEQMRTR